MTMFLANILAQVDPTKLDSGTPRIEAGSSSTTWIIVAVILVAVLLVAFKQARRNFRD
jgi:hypothetical protein